MGDEAVASALNVAGDVAMAFPLTRPEGGAFYELSASIRTLETADEAAGAAAKALSTGDELAGAAGRAVTTVGPGRGAAYGTRAHSAFEAEVNALGRGDLATEVSYLNGHVVHRGTAGSVRLDVVEGSVTSPSAIYDLKTGSAALTARRIAQIRSHLPGGYRNIPVHEVRP
jgi:hypothetical protein